MTPGKARILTCPHCGEKKEVLSLASGNTFGQKQWSDCKRIAPMLPQVSFVQQCHHCQGYFLLSRQTGYETGDDYSFDLGNLSYPELMVAYGSMKEDLTADEKRQVLLMLVWGFNDTYMRDAVKPVKNNDTDYFKRICLELIPLIDDPILKAELYRENGMMSEAREVLSQDQRTDDFLVSIRQKILDKIECNDSRVFCLND